MQSQIQFGNNLYLTSRYPAKRKHKHKTPFDQNNNLIVLLIKMKRSEDPPEAQLHSLNVTNLQGWRFGR